MKFSDLTEQQFVAAAMASGAQLKPMHFGIEVEWEDGE